MHLWGELLQLLLRDRTVYYSGFFMRSQERFVWDDSHMVMGLFGAVTAKTAADMALAGVKSIIPSDEVVQVMLEVGSSMPEKYR